MPSQMIPAVTTEGLVPHSGRSSFRLSLIPWFKIAIITALQYSWMGTTSAMKTDHLNGIKSVKIAHREKKNYLETKQNKTVFTEGHH